MNIQQGLLKSSKEAKPKVENIDFVFYLFWIIAFSPIVWISLYFINSNILQYAFIIFPCILMFILFLEVDDEPPLINYHSNKF